MPVTSGIGLRRTADKFRRNKWKGRRKRSQQSTARQLSNLRRKVRNITPETKLIDTTTSASFTTAGAIVPLTLCALGDEPTERDGDKIKIQSVDCYITNIGGTASDNTRIIIFWDTSSHGVVPAVSEVLATAAYDSHTNNENNTRFKIIKQFLFANNQNGVKNHFLRFYRKFNKTKTTSYQGTTAVQANLLQHHMYLLVIGDMGTNQSGFGIRTRIRFID